MIRTVLAAALVFAPAAAPAQEAPSGTTLPAPSGAMLEVNATGRSTRVPDVATIRAGVVAEATTAAAALAEQSSRMTAVLAALGRAGVGQRDIATAQVGLQPRYRSDDNGPPRITGYEATNSVTIRFRDVGRAGAILDALVAQGANQINGPDLSIDKPDAALDEARTDAMARARARAELYARAAGLHVLRIVSISEGYSDAGAPRPVFAARALAAAAPTPIVAGERDVSVTVAVKFLLG